MSNSTSGELTRNSATESNVGPGATRIPFMRVDRQFANHRDEFIDAMLPVLESGAVLQGPSVAKFERLLAELVGVDHAVACGSGTDAMILALAALRLREQSRIAVPTFTFVATASPILHARCLPVFVDCEPETGLPLESALVDLIERRQVDAVIVVHLYGQLLDLERVARAASRANIPIVEDAAQAFGATRHGKSFGQYGTLSTMSFDPMKVVGAFGSGGAVLTNDPDLARRLRQLRLHGHDGKGGFVCAGFNSQLPSIQAAILSVKLSKMVEWQARRADIAAIFNDALASASNARPMHVLPGNVHNWHKYVVRVARRDALLSALGARGVQCKIHYEVPLHRQPLFSGYARDARCPNAEDLSEQVISLPIYPELTDEEAQYISGFVKDVLGSLL